MSDNYGCVALIALPDEILFHTFSYLAFTEVLVRCSPVCKRLYCLILLHEEGNSILSTPAAAAARAGLFSDSEAVRSSSSPHPSYGSHRVVTNILWNSVVDLQGWPQESNNYCSPARSSSNKNNNNHGRGHSALLASNALQPPSRLDTFLSANAHCFACTRVLNLSHQSAISSSCLRAILGQCLALETLILYRADRIDDTAFDLESLHSDDDNDNDNGNNNSNNVFAISQTLTTIDISGTLISDVGIKLICRHARQLRRLFAADCGIRASGLRCILSELPHLTHLSVARSSLTDEDLKEVCRQRPMDAALSHSLRELNLSMLYITDSATPFLLAQRLPSLERLYAAHTLSWILYHGHRYDSRTMPQQRKTLIERFTARFPKVRLITEDNT